MPELIRYLEGNQVYLRPLELADVDFMVQISNNDVEMRRLTGTQTPFTRDQIEHYIQRQAQGDTRVSFGIVRRDEDRLVGEVVISDIHRNARSANFRIAISDAYTGNGFGTEATRLMLDYGFGMLNLHRIEIDVYTINERAIHVYEEVGFKREGLKRQNWYYDHQFYDTVIMSILEDEYRTLYRTRV